MQIVGEIGGFLTLLIAPYLYFENRKIRRLTAKRKRKITQEELEKLERNEETVFEEKVGFSASSYYGSSPVKIQRAIRRKEDYSNDAAKLKAVIEEQEEIENMSTFRGLFGLKPKKDLGVDELLGILAPKQALTTRIRGRFRKLSDFFNWEI